MCVSACACAHVWAFLSAEVGPENNFVESVLSINLYMGFGDQAQVVLFVWLLPFPTEAFHQPWSVPSLTIQEVRINPLLPSRG